MHDESETMVAVEVEETVTIATWGDDQPRPVTINVVIIDDQSKGEFCLISDPLGNGVPIVQDYVAKFDNNQNDVYSKGFLITFYLPDDMGKNVDWIYDDDPIWAKLADKHGICPNNKNDDDPSILTDRTLSPDKRYLTVTNENGAQEYFGFALRFKNKKNGRTLAYDPIGDNQNGNFK